MIGPFTTVVMPSFTVVMLPPGFKVIDTPG